MDFSPKLTPSRTDRLGPMYVPHDIYEFVTKVSGWRDKIEEFNPPARRSYLKSIEYWIDENGSCVIRSNSTSRFATIMDIRECTTIVYGKPKLENDVIPEPELEPDPEPEPVNP